ncbi:MAG: FkbM family methyltransferase, partial [Pseudomonadota bacterium]
VYYGDKARAQRMDALNAQFVHGGALAFDIGAHVGDRTGSFLRLGARIVALEPQPRVFRALRLIYRRNQEVVLRQCAVGASEGTLTLRVNSANPTISTASDDFVRAAQNADGWQGQVWDSEVTVATTTLDALIRQHGVPSFVKIDVEGHELEVLAGLSHQIPALSFEFTTIQRALANQCVDRLETLGRHQFNFSLGEDHSLALAEWADPAALKAKLDALPMSANSGDIYARCVET